MLYSNRRSSCTLESLENRQLLSLVTDVRLPGGGKSATVTSVGQVIKLELWATAKGANTSGSDDGVQGVFGSFLSSNINGGAAKGTLKATRVYPFTGSGSVDGAQKDLDGDGDLDVGNLSPDSTTVTGIFYGRSSSMTTAGGVVSGSSRALKIADLTFTVTSLLSGSSNSTQIRFANRTATSNVNAVWQEDGKPIGQGFGYNGSYLNGTPVTLTRGSSGTVYPGSIAGNVFRDANNNGAKDSGETNLAGWRVYIDSNSNGVFDSTEKQTTTDTSGNYRPSSLAGNRTYRVRLTLASGYRIINPSSGYRDVYVGSGANITGQSFAASNTTTTSTNGSIAGTVWKDSNANGVKDSGEVGLSGWRVYVDWDRNGTFNTPTDSKYAYTDSSGNYRLSSLSPNVNRRIRVMTASGYTIKTPSSGYYDITLSAGQNRTGINFGAVTGTISTGAIITGTIFSDNDSDKIRDSGEGGIANWRVFLDKDGDSIFDSTETYVLSDSSGNFRFSGLATGTYSVRVQPLNTTATWTRTTAWPSTFSLSSGQTKSGVLFGYHKG